VCFPPNPYLKSYFVKVEDANSFLISTDDEAAENQNETIENPPPTATGTTNVAGMTAVNTSDE